MDNIWMQFNDSEMTEPCGWSFWEQPIETWPYQAEVATSDPLYVAYYDSLLAATQALSPKPIAS
jgi:hypothetical protein